MRVLHIVPSTPFGGLQQIAVQLACQQRLLGLDAQIIALYDNWLFNDELQKSNVPFVVIRSPFLGRTSFSIQFHRCLTRNKPDIIHLHMTLLWSLLVLSLGRKPCPYIYHAHAYPPERPDYRHLLVKWLLSHKIDAIVGVSNSVTAAFQKCFGSNIGIYRTIYNGIHFSELAAKPLPWPAYMGKLAPSRPLIGMATRFATDKGIKEFLEVLPSILKQLPEARFVLAGDGPLLAWARGYAASLGLQDNIAFPGFIREMPQFWAGLDFALFTAPRETFGLTIIEPQATGTVVVGYVNGSGSDEIIIPGETGILVSRGNHDGLAQEISELWFDKQRYAQMANAALNRLETHFSLKKMSQDCLGLYRELKQ